MREINTEKKKRWVSLYVENRIGVLARISGMMSGKSYNISSITVGVTEDPTVSRMTIGLSSDDATFEQIKKQLNSMIEVIKVIDLTNVPIHMKEILFAKGKARFLIRGNPKSNLATALCFASFILIPHV